MNRPEFPWNSLESLPAGFHGMSVEIIRFPRPRKVMGVLERIPYISCGFFGIYSFQSALGFCGAWKRKIGELARSYPVTGQQPTRSTRLTPHNKQPQFQTMKSYQQQILTLAELGLNENQIAQALGIPEEVVIHVLAHFRRKEYGNRITQRLERDVFDFIIGQAMFPEIPSNKEPALEVLRVFIV